MNRIGGLMSGFVANGNNIEKELKAYRKMQQQNLPEEKEEYMMETTSTTTTTTRHPLDFVETMDVLVSVPNLEDDASDVEMIQNTEAGDPSSDSDSEDDIGPGAPTRRPAPLEIPEISIRSRDFRWDSFGCKKNNPYKGIPRDHPVFESMCFVVPHSDLLSHSGGLVMSVVSGSTTWGNWAPTESARATKCLLYLIIHAIDMCMRTPSGKIEEPS